MPPVGGALFLKAMQFICIFVGGGVGALLRYGAALLAGRWLGSALPGTLAVNVLGCLALGAVYGLTQSRMGCLSEEARLFISVGLLGALTTFSTLNWELFALLRSGRITCALVYLGVSLSLGLMATAAGYHLAQLR